MPELKCPRCGGGFAFEKHDGKTILRCNNCRGIWIDSSTLSQIVEERELDFPDEEVTESSVEKGEICCPVCGKAMQRVNYSYSTGIIIDRCPDGHGVWLDAGELKKIVKIMSEWDKKKYKVLETIDIEDYESKTTDNLLWTGRGIIAGALMRFLTRFIR
ncbi:zf-TFIIB domain-containing protein [bacterium]|nr:zf-TFIIB domain-containing protein [bacterium]